MRGITLFSLFNLALKNIFILIIAAVIFAVGAYGFCEYVAVPRYSATGSLLITNGALVNGTDINENGEITKLENADVIASINFMGTAADMLRQNGIYKELSERMGEKYTYNQLMGMSNIERREEHSLYIDVTFTTSSKAEAVEITNQFMDLTPEFFEKQVNSVKVSYFKVDNAYQVYPQTFMMIMLFALIGVIFVYAILLIIFLMNTTIVNEDDLKERFDVMILGSIPDFASARSKKYGKYYDRYGYYNKGGYYRRGTKQ